MVAWEKQLKERSVPAWRDKYVQYGKLKRKIEQAKAQIGRADSDDGDFMKKALSAAPAELEANLIDTTEGVKEFMEEVYAELDRVATFYENQVTALEARVREAISCQVEPAGAGAIRPCGDDRTEEIESLHLESAQLTEFVLLNVEALRKIVKKMDKTVGANEQKKFVENHLKRSALAGPGKERGFFDGHRARRCRQELEATLSPERIQELRSKAMSEGTGVGLSRMPMKKRRTLCCAVLAGIAIPLSAFLLPNAPRAQRCVGLVTFTVSMWVSEAAPFEATALFVPPLAVLLEVLEGTKSQQAKRILASVFSDSLYLVLCGFVISSVFTKSQLECRTAAALQRKFGQRPFLFMLAIMFLGLVLSSLLSNVTAPLLLIEVLKPLLKDMPTDSRYSRALLLGLAFSCNIGGMATPISSPQNVAALTILRQSGGNITWAQWLSVSVPFCSTGVFAGWLLLMFLYRFDASADELSRSKPNQKMTVPEVVFDAEEFTVGKIASLLSAFATLATFACQPLADFFGGTSMVAVMFVAIAIGTGMISRQTFNSYSWHLMFLIGGGGALGLAVKGSGLLDIMTDSAARCLSRSPGLLVAELVLVLVGATTFVSHTVAALVLMPLVVQLGNAAGVSELSVMVGGLGCSVACALPMTSFPNVNSLMAVDDHGKPWLAMNNFLAAGTPMTILMTLLLTTFGFWLATLVF
mmetsp:Transcript_69560/g.175641  ORF Transcript_69560/g.175641 Transcript_69560/m.175641 type:complete len:698 (+) Transcript_69560:51-2144(+)